MTERYLYIVTCSDLDESDGSDWVDCHHATACGAVDDVNARLRSSYADPDAAPPWVWQHSWDGRPTIRRDSGSGYRYRVTRAPLYS